MIWRLSRHFSDYVGMVILSPLAFHSFRKSLEIADCSEITAHFCTTRCRTTLIGFPRGSSAQSGTQSFSSYKQICRFNVRLSVEIGIDSPHASNTRTRLPSAPLIQVHKYPSCAVRKSCHQMKSIGSIPLIRGVVYVCRPWKVPSKRTPLESTTVSRFLCVIEWKTNLHCNISIVNLRTN